MLAIICGPSNPLFIANCDFLRMGDCIFVISVLSQLYCARWARPSAQFHAFCEFKVIFCQVGNIFERTRRNTSTASLFQAPRAMRAVVTPSSTSTEPLHCGIATKQSISISNYLTPINFLHPYDSQPPSLLSSSQITNTLSSSSNTNYAFTV